MDHVYWGFVNTNYKKNMVTHSNSGPIHTDTQHRRRSGTFTPSGGKSARQPAGSGPSKPQRTVGGCRNQNKAKCYSIPYGSSAKIVFHK